MVMEPPLEMVKFLHAAPIWLTTGMLPPPEIIISSVLSGIPPDQFPTLFQSELTAPVQTVALEDLGCENPWVIWKLELSVEPTITSPIAYSKIPEELIELDPPA